MITNKDIFEAAKNSPRQMYHVVLSMIIFTPENSDIRREIESVLDSVAFSAPENVQIHANRMPNIIVDRYGENEADWPEFIKIMMTIFSLHPCYLPDTAQILSQEN